MNPRLGVRTFVALFALAGFVVPGAAQEKPEAPDARIERLKREVEAARKDAARQEYYRRIAQAEDAWRTRSLEEAKRVLESCSPQLRDWEWHYLKRLFSTGARAVPGSRCVAFSPDGNRVATADGHSVKVWELSTGRAVQSLSGHAGDVLAVAFSRDGKRLASCSADKSAIVWDTTTGKPVVTLRGHTAAISRLAIAPDGTRVATASDDGSAKVWDIATGKELVTLSGHGRPVIGIAFSHDGRRVATADGEGVKVWNASDGKVGYAIEGRDQVVAFSPDGRSLAVAGRGDAIRVFESGKAKLRYTIGHISEGVRCLAFSADSKLLVTGFASGRDYGRFRIWDAADGQENLTERGHREAILDAAFGPDGKLLATVGPEGSVRIWSLSGEREATTFRSGLSRLSDLAISPDGKWLAATPAVYTNDGPNKTGLRTWETASGKEVFLATPPKPYWVGPVAFSPDGGRIGFGNAETVEVWDTGTRKQIVEVKFDLLDHVASVAFSPDGKRFAAATSRHMKLPQKPHDAVIWDAGTGKRLLTLTGHADSIDDVGFSRDGKWIATAGQDRTARLWDAQTGKERFSLACANSVSAVAFSPDSQRLATAGGIYLQSSKEMTVWDVATGKALFTFPEKNFWPIALSWSPDGRRLAVGSLDGDVKLIDTSTGLVVLTLPFKNIVTRLAFSPDGRRLYAAGRDQLDGRLAYWDATPFSAKE